ncbi:hypothetical protein [Mycobacterium sp. NAZ190054]|uniref:hypothetical protein n=1 Tax=Mycobacterium sp. NAZ190054 TaxID=1747766 RepID=UPI0007988B01|nr:hypothetical protein [Mycobacterium sp. NAZ190054]KWX67568.1 hypothetical protein ASJ79_21345 [Mycobacterium sp. NAZ190054]
MSVLRAILDLQGALDTATVRTGDPRVAEIADRFLPGSSSTPGWYRELLAFMLPGVPQVDADPTNAILALQETGSEPTAPEQARLIYALGAVIHLTRNVPDSVALPFDDPTTGRARSALVSLLGLTFPEPSGSEWPAAPQAFRDEGDEGDELQTVITLFDQKFTGWQDWYDVAQQLVALGVLSADAAAVPLCRPSVVSIGGRDAIVVDTDFTSLEVSLNQVKGVADPRNWDENYPAFFCHMEYRNLRPDGWRRVLETVGICAFPPPIGIQLKTMLKFFKTTVDLPGSHSARLDYDLNDPLPDQDSDGRITIDRGYINMWAPQGNPDAPPVAVRTRKVVRIEGMRPFTQGRFVCIFGYAYATMEMLFGSAKRPPGKGEYRSPWLDAPEIPDGTAQSSPAPHPDNSAASTVITMAVQCVEDMTTRHLDVTDKWMSGQLTLTDLAQYSAEVGARIASEPWRIMLALSKPKGSAK